MKIRDLIKLLLGPIYIYIYIDRQIDRERVNQRNIINEKDKEIYKLFMMMNNRKRKKTITRRKKSGNYYKKKFRPSQNMDIPIN